MSDIPEEVVRKAAEVVNIVIKNYENNIAANNGRDIVAVAIMGERLRCAEIANNWNLLPHPKLSPGAELNAWWSGQEVAAGSIASAIMGEEK